MTGGSHPERPHPAEEREESALVRFSDVRDQLSDLAEGMEGARSVSEVFFEALSLLPSAVPELTRTASPDDAPLWAHTLARNIYYDGLKAVENQGPDVKGNGIVQLVASQGLVLETQALIDLAARK